LTGENARLEPAAGWWRVYDARGARWSAPR